ncbi:MAG TPA: ATP-binding protein [Anaeromyxobacteraceae bacterium]|nr:ATP-binding protein [Anaeromyxobacteraceae bacterium]
MTTPPPTPGGAPPWARWLRRPPRWLRVSRFERNIAIALVIGTVVPLVGALWLAAGLAEQDLTLGLSPRVVSRLEAVPGVYGELFQARKQLYALQAREVARGLPSDRDGARRHLERAVSRTPGLRRAAVLQAGGALLASAEARGPGPEGGWRPAAAHVKLPGGAVLECTFAVEARLFAELDETRTLAEQSRELDRLRDAIQRSYVLSYGTLLAVLSLLAAAAGIWFARRTTRRVDALVAAVRKLAGGDLSVQVQLTARDRLAGDEISALAAAFNEMVREVRESRGRIVYLEKISGWQEIARRLAHEIKNPLTPIQLAFQELEARWKRSPGDASFGPLLAEAGEIVREEVGTLQRLVADFSAFAKLPEAAPEPADLGDFVEDFVRTNPQLAEQAEVEVVRTGPCPTAVDRVLMRRVLANLAANAVEASRPARARIHLGVARTRSRVLLTVSDEGPGIDAEMRERIFDPYFTTKTDGTGLGLAIVKKIVLQHGGDIEAGARPGGGATFCISLPLAEAAAPGAGEET